MKFTLSWLKNHLETAADLPRIAQALTALGLEVEEVVDRAKALAPFTVAEVVSAEPHPNADKLRVCEVDTGADRVQVVCGAPNARAGMKGVFAPPGTVIPGTGLALKAGVIRGVASNGMLCSEREMGLSDEHEGIIELAPDAPVGAPFARVLGLDDPVIDVALTPDRGDCAGVRGIARDLAAAGLGRLKALAVDPVPGRFPSPIGVALALPEEARDACPLFVGRFIRGVRNGPSPRWLQDRLRAVGLRPISALVDITNYLTLDLARPLHVFDADAVAGSLTVRLAHAGETLEALNGKDYVLDDAVTVIADADGVLALGGVIGGVASGCTEETVNVFVECALFDPRRTAATGRRLGIESDARYRFERGVDPAFVIPGMEVATRLILELCGGEPGEVVIAGAVPAWQRTIRLRPTRLRELSGTDVPVAQQVGVLEALGARVGHDADGTPAIDVPSWRADIHGEPNLVEEVLRIVGFDTIPAVPLDRPTPITRAAVTAEQRRAMIARRTLAARGLLEAVTWSFMAAEHALLFGPLDPELRLANPISSELDAMRPSILGNLVQAAGRNADRGYPDVGLFEVGPVYRTPRPDGQDLVAAGIRAGAMVPRHWAAVARPVDAFDAKADALGVLQAVGAPAGNLQVTADAPRWYHPGRSGSLRLGDAVLGWFGELHPSVAEALGAKGRVVGFEVVLDRVPQPRHKAGTARPPLKPSPFQPVVRDFAFVVDRSVPAEKVIRAARSADKALIADVSVFDVYTGPGIEPGRKSLAISVTLQPTAGTPTDEQIEAVAARIVAQVTKATGGSLRT